MFSLRLPSARDFGNERHTFRHAGKRAHHLAFRETFLIAALSTAPIWLAMFLRLINVVPHDDLWIAFQRGVVDYMGRGQLFIISTSSLATVLWLGIKEMADKKYASQEWAIILSVLFLILGFVFFINDTIRAEMKMSIPENSRFLLYSSGLTYVASVVYYYYLSVLHNSSLAAVFSNMREQRIEGLVEGLSRNTQGGLNNGR